jgi:hypothetical protein
MDGGDQRVYPRFGLGLRVTLLFSQQGVRVDGELQDISRGGCFFKSSAKVDVNRKISISFSLNTDKSCQASGQVIRTTAYKGFAVLFEETNQSISDFISDLAGLPLDRRAKFADGVLNSEIQIT